MKFSNRGLHNATASMDDQPLSANANENQDKKNKKPKFQYSQTTTSKSNTEVDAQTGSLTEVSSSEQMSTDNTDLSSADVSVNVFSNKTEQDSLEKHIRVDSMRGPDTEVHTCSLRSVKVDQPKPLDTLLPSSTETCTLPGASQSSSVRSQDSLKSATVHTEPDGSDYCAAILLACLFCHPLDCLLETFRGCAWSLCSSLCGCEHTTLQSLLEVTEGCDLCGCLGARCFMCDCDICLPVTGCLDLAMELSQMLYH